MYAHPITVDSRDIDHMGHVNNAVYLRWVQDAVTRYWEAVAPAEAVARHLWVALKHEISYRRLHSSRTAWSPRSSPKACGAPGRSSPP